MLTLILVPDTSFLPLPALPTVDVVVVVTAFFSVAVVVAAVVAAVAAASGELKWGVDLLSYALAKMVSSDVMEPVCRWTV